MTIEGCGPWQVKLQRNVRIPMPDGVTLAADLHLPEGAGEPGEPRFPVILEYTPYHKTHNTVYGPRATRYPYFASHGYVFVNVDIRGCGDSGGANTAPTSPEEVADLLEVLRWCAAQPWSDGNVGMIGISYTAGVCYDAARHAPEELKAIIVCQMCSDWWEGVAAPGGSPRPFIYENFAPLMAAYQFAPPDPAVVGNEWERLWRERLEGSRPWGLAYAENLRDGEYWESRLLRGHEEEVRAATFLIGGWCDWYPDDMLRVFSRLRSPKRALIGPWTHNYPENAWPLPRLNDRWECLRWFDRHLKGKDTDPERPVDAEPPITLFVREHAPPDVLRREDPGHWRPESVWPPTAAESHTFHLRTDSARSAPLSEETSVSLAYDPAAGRAAGRYAIGHMLPGWGMAGDQRLEEPHSLVFPLPELPEGDLVGIPEAVLFVSCSAPAAFLSAKLCDVAPDGSSVLITKGGLNLVYRHGSQSPEPLIPGQVYEIRLPLQATAHRLRPGHRLRLLLAAADFQNYWPTPLPHTLTVHLGTAHPSRVLVPLAGSPAPALPEPRFLPSDFAPIPPEEMNFPEYAIHHDLVGDALEVRISTRSGCGTNRSRYRVHRREPAVASIESEYEYPLERPGFSARIHSRCETRSTATTFRHSVTVKITLNGEAYWQKEWVTEDLPRADIAS
jgi:putative CocE/NonD family hydrolase